MRKIKLLTDSTCDLSNDLLEKYAIDFIPLYVQFGEESYLDRIDIDTKSLYEKVEQSGVLPKTAAINQATFMEVFQKYLDADYDIIFTGISKAMSRTYENAVLAAQSLDESRIKIVDSMNLSTGIGLILIEGSLAIQAGKSLLEVVDVMENATKRVRSQFVIPTMEYLYKGGRCGGIAHFVGTMLKIKPLIVVREGKMSVGRKPHGKMKVALTAMLEMLKQDEPNIKDDYMFITHSLNEEDACYLKEVLGQMFPKTTIYTTCAGCVISAHCGKGTIGILYALRD